MGRTLLSSLIAGLMVVSVADSFAQGSMAPSVRKMEISRSITMFGNTREGRRAKARVIQDNNQHRNKMELERLRSRNQRALEADRAYYKKLEFQRKQRGW